MNREIKQMFSNKISLFFALLLMLSFGCTSEKPMRIDIDLNKGWVSIANDTNQFAYQGFEVEGYNTEAWQNVDVPHNWDDYGGYRRLTHGNRHGYAWYKKTFSVDMEASDNKRYFLFFEGVGSYATVWVNGKEVGEHAGGRTTFTLDITDAIYLNGENTLSVRADHPADIQDLPWVCGGCSPEWGFSEGSQPMGIFRPVHLIVTNEVRIEPFGVHIWNDENISSERALLHINTEVKNYGNKDKTVLVSNKLIDHEGKDIAEIKKEITITAGKTDTLKQQFDEIKNPNLWSIDNPYLYKVKTEILENGKVLDRTKTSYGIRWIKWDIHTENSTNRFYLNGEPVFINGTAEYEHILGQSHAFSDDQINARVEQIRAMGFNTFRDGHQPHNFRYHEAWDSLGMLWWTQMAAHIWFDNPEFKRNFKTLLHDWVKERRNSPSIILWGLENESTLPTDFAEECANIIREMDPTCSSQRLVTTCNGGTGTDWNVIQNWSGTYGGIPENYDKEISEQLLNGEYGAWRSIDLHSEGEFNANGILSEDRACLLMESKIRLAEKAREHCCGQFHWLFNSHDNPGRTQAGEGLRDIDRLGPINYKGTVTIWGEPLDLFYMFRSNYADKQKEPMVYIVSHTWPSRWTEPGIKNGIRVFSNCDEVELFNGIGENSLGRQKHKGIGTHFIFDNANIQTNVLRAVGYVDGKEVASDVIVLNHLPKDNGLKALQGTIKALQASDKNVIYRVNCGGGDYTDKQGNLWMADVHRNDDSTWGSMSWTDDYEGMPAFYGSQRQTFDPIEGTNEWPLIQTFLYGRHKLNYQFPLPDGEYQLELYFIEPWYGTGGGMDCEGWRLFDVAVNDEIVLNDVDIWKEAGHDKLLKKTIDVTITGGLLKVSFPEVKSGQAVISAIAVSSKNNHIKPVPSVSSLINNLEVNSMGNWSTETWMNIGEKSFSDSDIEFVALPPVLYGAEWIKTPRQIVPKDNSELASFRINEDADIYLGVDASLENTPEWLTSFVSLKQKIVTTEPDKEYRIYQKTFSKDETVKLMPTDISKEHGMYFIAAVPVTSLDDPIDLRTSVRYEAEAGNIFGNSKMTNFMGKTCIHVPNKNSSIAFKFQVGLASKYGLEFRYMNMGDHAIEADVEIRAADNRLMWSGIWSFLSANVKWQSLRTDTQTTINAGEYTIKITPKENESFYFDWVKVK